MTTTLTSIDFYADEATVPYTITDRMTMREAICYVEARLSVSRRQVRMVEAFQPFDMVQIVEHDTEARAELRPGENDWSSDAECGTCGETLEVGTILNGFDWEHAEAADDAACADVRGDEPIVPRKPVGCHTDVL